LTYVFDLIVLTTFVLVQWRITRLLLRASAERWTGRRLTAARAAIFAMDAALLFGYLLSFAQWFTWLHLPRRLAAWVEGIVLLYLVFASGAVTLRAIVGWIGRRWNRDADPGRRKVLQFASKAAVATPALVLGYGSFVQRLDFHVKEVEVAFPDLPQDLNGLRILQLSDIHRGPFLSDGDLDRVMGACLDLRPNLAVVTGDLISAHGDPLDSCIRQLARVKADAGVFGCMGNHERYAAAERYTEVASARVGIRFLRGAAQSLRFGSATLNLAGVDYQAKSSPYLEGAERLMAPGAFNLLLTHNPDVFPVAARQGYNLLLAGHTHGGQVTVEILDESINPARFFTPFIYGVYRSGRSAMYVTRGIGTIGLPTRIGAPPEVTLLRLAKA
jgi:predicted MPP superfamily phosphohydrolase